MGRMLGVFDNDEELDRPDLNKCPDCGCFFPGNNCPLCGKECPEEMRAGNRKPVKKKRVRRSQGSGRVTFIEWYHSWWFIVIMMFIMPIAGIILLVTSPHQRWKKLLFVGIAVIYMIVSTFGIMLVPYLVGLFEKPVDTSLSKDEYVAACKTVSAEYIYRSPTNCEDEFVTITLKVVSIAECAGGAYDDDVYYICEATDGSDLNIIVRSCLIENDQKFLTGDVITVYGEGAGELGAFYTNSSKYVSAPSINMAYVVINGN
jgi:hypothetical protein